MGKQLLDQYSLLHFACGVVAYFWGVRFSTWVAAHVAFEVLENCQLGMFFINQISNWPGGKPSRDSLLNFVGDNVCAFAGWWCA